MILIGIGIKINAPLLYKIKYDAMFMIPALCLMLIAYTVFSKQRHPQGWLKKTGQISIYISAIVFILFFMVKDRGFEGILITDDFNMVVVVGSQCGIGVAAIKAINARGRPDPTLP